MSFENFQSDSWVKYLIYVWLVILFLGRLDQHGQNTFQGNIANEKRRIFFTANAKNYGTPYFDNSKVKLLLFSPILIFATDQNWSFIFFLPKFSFQSNFFFIKTLNFYLSVINRRLCTKKCHYFSIKGNLLFVIFVENLVQN